MKAAFWVALAVAAAAQQPNLQNAQLMPRSASGGLEPAVRSLIASQTTPVWIGWLIPSQPGNDFHCNWDQTAAANGKTVYLEGAPFFFVLLRVERQEIRRIRSVPADCAIDANGLPVYWLSDVKPSESVAFMAARADDRSVGSPAIQAISLHADPAATPLLIRFARGHAEERVRKRAAFWLARSKDPGAWKFFEDVLTPR